MRTLNSEGVDWEEWANAAAIPFIGAKAIYLTHEPKLYLAERAAWANGEDPTEWRRAAEIEKTKGRGRRNG